MRKAKFLKSLIVAAGFFIFPLALTACGDSGDSDGGSDGSRESYGGSLLYWDNRGGNKWAGHVEVKCSGTTAAGLDAGLYDYVRYKCYLPNGRNMISDWNYPVCEVPFSYNIGTKILTAEFTPTWMTNDWSGALKKWADFPGCTVEVHLIDDDLDFDVVIATQNGWEGDINQTQPKFDVSPNYEISGSNPPTQIKVQVASDDYSMKIKR